MIFVADASDGYVSFYLNGVRLQNIRSVTNEVTPDEVEKKCHRVSEKRIALTVKEVAFVQDDNSCGIDLIIKKLMKEGEQE